MNFTKNTPSVHSIGEEGHSFLNSSIHPTALIGPDVIIGSNVSIGPYSVITGKVILGNGTKIYSHVTIGYAAQDLGTHESLGTIEIGQNCVIREFSSIHASKKQNGQTFIGNNCYIMAYCHIAHDCIIEDNVVLINNVMLAGHTHVAKHAFLMANAATHQWCRIGNFSALSPFSGTRQDLPPFCLFEGKPARFAGINYRLLKRHGISQESGKALSQVTHLFYKKKLLLEDIYTQAQQEPSWGADHYVQAFLAFIKESSRGVSRKTLNDPSSE